MTAPVPLRRVVRPGRLAPGDATDAVAQGARFQGAAKEATNAAAADAGDAFSVDVGQRLGNLAGIGALRSGGVAAGLRDAGKTYSTAVSRAASANALQAAQLGQNEASSLRSDATAREGIASNERISAADLGFKEKGLAEQSRQFGQDLGFRQTQLTSSEQQAAAERASREGIAGQDIASREKLAGQSIASQEKLAGQDVASREKLAALQLEFQNRGLSSEEARAAAQNQLQRDLSAADLGFKEKSLASEDSRFSQDLGFRQTQATTQADLERARQAETQREFDLQRQDAAKAAQQKKKSGLFGFIGKALGTAVGFIPGGSTVVKAVKSIAGGH